MNLQWWWIFGIVVAAGGVGVLSSWWFWSRRLAQQSDIHTVQMSRFAEKCEAAADVAEQCGLRVLELEQCVLRLIPDVCGNDRSDDMHSQGDTPRDSAS